RAVLILREVLAWKASEVAELLEASLLLRAAGIALADGPYTPAERDVLTTIGAALTLPREEVTDLLTAARTPS
ncbi:TerB family tellurite resistance protein, partial [Streptomyces albidoflavus]